jgi:queuine tRNA-ribosyltransferase
MGPVFILALDDCPPWVSPEAKERDEAQRLRVLGAVARDSRTRKKGYDQTERIRIANERTLRWLERCKAAHARPDDQALFGITQGGADLEQRTWCAERVVNIDLPGYAIGGVAVGESPEVIAQVVSHTAPLLPEAKPRYLMGVGYERDILAAVRAGVDMFDCVLPTRNGRNANAFTPTGQIRLKNNKYAADPLPIQPGCDCHACDPARYRWNTPDGKPFSRAYLRHLFAAGEMLGPILVSLHNLRHFQRFMMDIQITIRNEDWSGLVGRWPVSQAGFSTAHEPDGGPQN